MGTRTTFEAVHTIQPIHTGGPAALSQDGRVLATCVDEDVLLTDLQSGRQLAKIEGDGDAVTALSLTPSASHLIVCSRSLSMRIYTLDQSFLDSISVELARTLRPHSAPVVTLATDDTGSLLASGAADGLVKVFDVRGGYTTHSLQGHGGVVSALHFFKLSGNQSVSFKQPSKPSKKERKSSESKDGEASVPVGLPNFRLASGDEDGRVRIWHLQERKCINVLDSHASVVRGLDFDEQNQILLSASRDKAVILWDSETWKIRNTIPILEEVEAAGFISQYTGLFYTGGHSGKLRLWWTSGQEVTEEQEPGGEGQSIVQMLYMRNQAFILSVHSDQDLLLHSLKNLDPKRTKKCLPLEIERRICGTYDEITDIAYVDRGGRYLAVATNLEQVKIISLNKSDDSQGGRGADVGILQGHDDIVVCIDVDWSGHWLVTGAKDNTARLWAIDAANSSFVSHATFTGHAESVGAVALPKQSPREGSPQYNSPLQYSPKYVLTGSQDKTIKCWDTSGLQNRGSKKAYRAIYTRKAHDKDINALDINHDSSIFLSASQDRTVKIWSFEDGEPIGVLRGHRRGVWAAKFAPPGTPQILGTGGTQSNNTRGYALTGSGDRTVKIWSLTDFSCLRTFEGHTNSVLKVLWLNSVPQGDHKGENAGEIGDLIEEEPKGRTSPRADVQVVSAGSDGLVKVWDVSSGECACTLDNHTDRVWALALNPNPPSTDLTPAAGSDAHTLISGGADSTLTLWKNTTLQTRLAASKVMSQRIEEDQTLQNYIRSRSYHAAIRLALKLNHPARLLALFNEVRKTWPREEGSLTGVKDVDTVLSRLNEHELSALLGRCREWNANNKTAPIAQMILWVLLKCHPASRFTQQQNPLQRNIKDTLDALRVYTERHYKRMEDLVDESFLVEYTLREMDEVLGASATLKPKVNDTGVNGDRLLYGDDEDEIMVD